MKDNHLGVGALADRMLLSPRTIYNRLSSNPGSLPPRAYCSNARKVVWAQDVVEAWIKERQSSNLSAFISRREGRWFPTLVRDGEAIGGEGRAEAEDAWGWVKELLA